MDVNSEKIDGTKMRLFSGLTEEQVKSTRSYYLTLIDDCDKKEYLLSFTNAKEITDIYNTLTVEERSNFINILSDKEKMAFTKTIRDQAVMNYWTFERELIKAGFGTRNWTPEQMEAILNVGVSGTESINGGKGFQLDADGNIIVADPAGNISMYGHHMMNVKDYPQYAGDFRNIQALDYYDHKFLAHDNGNTQSPTNWYFDYDYVDPKTGEIGKRIEFDPNTIDFNSQEYPPIVEQTIGFRSDDALRCTYPDFDNLTSGEQISLRYIDKVLIDSNSVEDLNLEIERLSASKKYGVTKFDNLRFYVDENNNIICDNLTEITGGEAITPSSDYIFDATIKELKTFAADEEVRAAFGTDYDNFTKLEKMEAAQIYSYVEKITNLDGAPIPDDILGNYLAATGKTVDSLDNMDNVALAIANKIGNKSDDVASLLSKVSKYDKVFKVASKVGGVVDVACNVVVVGSAVMKAKDAFESGDNAKGTAIMVEASTELAVGVYCGSVLTANIAPYFIGVGAAVGGGPIGAAIGAALAGIVGYGVAGIMGSVVGDILSDLILDIDDLFHTAEVQISPLILDLDGDGTETISVDNGVYFDHDDNGFIEKTGWVGKDDGLLVRDINGNGIIDGGSELFGDNTLLNNGTKAANGFLALADLDSNLDSVIDINDDAYDELFIWKDSNSNGITDNGEIITLADANVTSISTGYSESSIIDSQGNEHKQIGSYIKSDGTTAAIDDVWFNIDSADTVYKDSLEETAEISGLPDFVGVGNTYSLHQAMLYDDSKHLQNLVEQFIVEEDIDAKKLLVVDIIYAWTGVEDIDPTSLGSYIGDARKLEALEVILGEEYLGRNENPRSQSTSLILEAFDKFSDFFYTQLIAQTKMKNLYSKVVYTWDEESNSLSYDISAVATEILNNISIEEETGRELLSEFVTSMYNLQMIDKVNYDDFREAFVSKGLIYTKIVDSAGKMQISGTSENDSLTGSDLSDALWGLDGEDVIDGNDGEDYIFGEAGDDKLYGDNGNDSLHGGTGSDQLYGEYGNDVLVGGEGNDTLSGDKGSDTYIFNLGDGIDTIKEYDSGSIAYTDKLVFGEGIGTEDIEVKRNGYHLELSITGTEDKVILSNYYSASNQRASIETRRLVEEIRFADGTVWSHEDVMSRIVYTSEEGETIYGTTAVDVLDGEGGDDKLYGGNGNDSLHGGTGSDQLYGDYGNDILVGGEGNDTLSGYYGNDTYVFNLGAGLDVINEYDSSTPTSTDLIETNQISYNIEFEQSNNDLIVHYSQDDELKVNNWFYNIKYQVESIDSSEKTISSVMVNQLIDAMSSLCEEKSMSWQDLINGEDSDYKNLIDQYWVTK